MSHDIKTIGKNLRDAGYRLTMQRQLVLDAICELGGHVTPEMVYTAVSATQPTINQATIYRSLQFLAEVDVLTVTQLRNGRSGYEIATNDVHHHLVCRNCQTNIELPQTAVSDLYAQVQKEHEFTIDMNHISFFGLCKTCSSSAK